MRTLLYIPVIHEAADLGTVSDAAALKGRDLIGQEEWEHHRKVVESFWEQIARYFREIEANGLEIFQDGLPFGGVIAERIIREGAHRGSRNHQIVLDLMKRGAHLRKTEDLELLQKELIRAREYATNHLADKTESIICDSGNRLLADRDRFAAQRINKTLERRGVLFIGAFHEITAHLDKDIDVRELKQKDKIAAYLKILYGKGPRELLTLLSAYMVSPITHKPDEALRCHP